MACACRRSCAWCDNRSEDAALRFSNSTPAVGGSSECCSSLLLLSSMINYSESGVCNQSIEAIVKMILRMIQVGPTVSFAVAIDEPSQGFCCAVLMMCETNFFF